MANFTKIAVVPLLLLLFFTVSASAEYTLNKAYFMDKYPNLTRQDFSASPVPFGDSETCSGPLNTFSDNPCIGPGAIHPDISFNTGTFAANNLWMLGQSFQGANNPNNALVSSFSNAVFLINFANSQVADVVGLNIGCLSKDDFPNCLGSVRVETLGFGGVVIGGFELEISDEFNSFLGIAAEDTIRQVRIIPLDPDEELGLFVGVDAVYFGKAPRNVPTMSEWGLLATIAGLGIIGLIVVRRRKRAFN